MVRKFYPLKLYPPREVIQAIYLSTTIPTFKTLTFLDLRSFTAFVQLCRTRVGESGVQNVLVDNERASNGIGNISMGMTSGIGG